MTNPLIRRALDKFEVTNLAETELPPGYVITAGVDIKPGSSPNSIDLCCNGTVPTAIVGSDTFDGLDVDIDTVRFAEVSVKVVGKDDPHSLRSYEDINDDFVDEKWLGKIGQRYKWIHNLI